MSARSMRQWRPEVGQRVRSREYAAEGVVTLVRGDVALVRLEGEGLSKAITSLMTKIIVRRQLEAKVEHGWSLLASMGEAEAERCPLELIWLCGDLEPADTVH